MNMNLRQFPLMLASCVWLAAAQVQPAAPAVPPPGVEEALRERVRPFYQAHVDEKYRKAYDVVADDSKDAFITATKPRYDGFEIQKIVFSSDYTTAAVTTEIHTTFQFWGRSTPEKTTEDSYWKMVDGQWYWYIPPPAAGAKVYTPAQRLLMGMFHVTPEGETPAAPAAPSPLPSGNRSFITASR